MSEPVAVQIDVNSHFEPLLPALTQLLEMLKELLLFELDYFLLWLAVMWANLVSSDKSL